jgi:hypothetical protein
VRGRHQLHTSPQGHAHRSDSYLFLVSFWIEELFMRIRAFRKLFVGMNRYRILIWPDIGKLPNSGLVYPYVSKNQMSSDLFFIVFQSILLIEKLINYRYWYLFLCYLLKFYFIHLTRIRNQNLEFRI